MKKARNALIYLTVLVSFLTLAACNSDNAVSSDSPSEITRKPSVDDTSSHIITEEVPPRDEVPSQEEMEKIYSFDPVPGGYKITEYKESEATVEIPAQYNGESIVEIGDAAFCSKDVSVVILPNTIVRIGDMAFADTQLVSINFPITLKHIGQNAFQNCNLKNVVIPESVSFIGRNAFTSCKSLESVTYNAIDCEAGWVQYLTFYATTYDDVIENVYPIFSSCEKLTSIEIGENVQSIPPFLFAMIHSVNSISIPQNIESIGFGAFHDCTNLETLYYNAKNATPFYNRKPPVEGALRTYSIFDSTTLLKVEFGPNVESINDRLFWNCVGLSTLVIPNNITHIEPNALYGCTGLEELIVGTGVKEIVGLGGYDMGYQYGDGYSLLGAPYILRAELNGVETLTDQTISGNTVIETLILGNVKYITENAFNGCKGLTNLSLPDTILSIDSGISSDCKLLEYNIYENGKYLGNDSNPYAYFVSCIESNATFTLHPDTKCIGFQAFDGCQDLKEIRLPDNLNSIDAKAFASCSALSTISIPEMTSYIGYSAFENCTNLSSIELPRNITHIEDRTFCNTPITEIVIPYGVTRIGPAFQNCQNLQSISIPETVSFIHMYAFENVDIQRVDITSIAAWCQLEECGIIYGNYYSQDYDLYLNGELVTEVNIPEGVTYIGNSVFEGNKNITQITIPTSVTYIGYGAFQGCENLIEIIYNGTKSEWNNIELKNNGWNPWNYGTGEYIIYCSNGKIVK